MKKLLLILLAVSTFLSCSSGGNETKETTADIHTSFSPIIKGTWVMTDYITDLQKTKSPKASAGVLQGVVSMEIDPADPTGDTSIVSASLNNHEGMTFYLFYRPGQDGQSLTTALTDEDGSGNFYELAYNISGTDTTLQLKHYNKEKKLLDTRGFTRVTGPLTDDSEPYGLQYMANKVLLSGTYNVTDDEGNAFKAELTDDGMAKGVAGHTTYYIFTDFIGDEQTNLDEMVFDPGSKTQKPYIFEIKADTVWLYKAMENEERTLLIKGPLKYTMVRMQ
ncbi:MAG: hypothetical protein H3C54_01360 [Taibaiella sp.]|nr:hypothetical protein [Taibaiella sp.]